MNFEPTPAQAEARRRAANFVGAEVLPHAAGWNRAGSLPRELIRRLGREGFLGGPIPATYGGRGWDNVAMAGVYEEFGAGDQSVRGFLSVQIGLVSQCLLDHGDETQCRAWLPRLVSGEAVGCYALTEEGAGSDVAAMTTRAEPDGDGWRISGEKVWITNGGIADLVLVFAKTEPAAHREGITAFLLPPDVEGLSRRTMEGEILGHRASDHARLRFDGAHAGRDDVLGEIGGGFGVAMSALDHGRLGVAAGGVGSARACLEASLDHCRRRRQFGRRIGDFQMVQERLADLAAGVEASRLLVLRAAWLADRGEPATRAVSIAKTFATDTAQRAAETALLLLASRGYTDLSDVERHYRDVPGLRIYEGTNLIQRIVVARDLLGPEPDDPETDGEG